MASQKNRCELFSAWVLILEVASKGRKDTERGSLIRGSLPLNADDLAMMTGFPANIFSDALKFFSSPNMGWLIVDNESLGYPPDKTGEHPDKTGESPAEGRKEGIEEKGIEEAPLPFIGSEFSELWKNWNEHLKQKRKIPTPLATKQQLEKLKNLGLQRALAMLRHSISGNYQGLYEPPMQQKSKPRDEL
jgi:hypothetical protein